MKKVIAFIVIALLLPIPKSIANNKVIKDHLHKELAKASSSTDSLQVLYDLWDISSRKDQMGIGNQIFALAERANMPEVQFDILRLMTNITNNDSILKDLEARVLRMPESGQQKETLLFIRIKQTSIKARFSPESERQKRIAEIINRNDFDSLDKYGKIACLFAICEYLSNYADGELLIEYMDDLGKLMDEADLENYALKNIYYTESANIYTNTGKGNKAIEADRKLLEIIDQLEKEYKAQGRRYRNYNTTKFTIYRRMLSNYKWLSTEEVNKIYEDILALMEEDVDVKANFYKYRRVSAYHAMKNKRYSEAIPYILDNIDNTNSVFQRKQLCEMLIEASEKTGDKNTLEKAKKRYASIKQEYDSLHNKSKYNELKVRYQVNILKTDKNRLELENKDAQITSARRIMTFVIVGWVAFGIILILMAILWTRYKRNTLHLSKFVDSLAREREKLKVERYGKPKIKPGEHKLLPKRTQKHTVDGMINFILNDLLYISSMGHDEHKFIEKVDVIQFMQERANTLLALSTKNIELKVKYPETDFNIFVDKECLVALTDHILHLAIRLSPIGGEVGYEGYKDETGKNAKFVFWHTGNPLPDGKEELIFDNFITFDALTGEKEAARGMCRMIHLLIDSSIKLEKSENSAKLILTIPLHNAE